MPGSHKDSTKSCVIKITPSPPPYPSPTTSTSQVGPVCAYPASNRQRPVRLYGTSLGGSSREDGVGGGEERLYSGSQETGGSYWGVTGLLEVEVC